jgi:GntR family transcriptional repressor for pyruvate dehydrogenase complex
MLPDRHDITDSAGAVVAHVRALIDRGALRPGGRLPAERDLARLIGVSRPTVRAGLRTLAALGVVRARRGSGTYIPDGPPALGIEALSFLAALHKVTVDDLYEVRRMLEVGAAGLAAVRATPEQLATLADEVAGLFASLADRQLFLTHDANFHRGIAAASGNLVVASLAETVSALYDERRRATAEHAVDRDLRDAADAHRQIYRAIRARDPERARRAMDDHLLKAWGARSSTARRVPDDARRTSHVEPRMPNDARRTPTIEHSTPHVERRTPSVERRPPGVERRTSNAEPKGSSR